MPRKVFKGGPALKADHAAFFERPRESERGNKQALWLTLIVDFNRCCGESGSARLRAVCRRVRMGCPTFRSAQL
jgi:hypothetical protein